MRSGIRKPARRHALPGALRRRREEAPAQAHERPAPAEAAPRPEERCRRANGPEDRERFAGGPQDKALYVCRCGSAFQAVVTASVSCPHCGDPQAW